MNDTLNLLKGLQKSIRVDSSLVTRSISKGQKFITRRVGEIQLLEKFQNTMSTFFITGAAVKEALENSVKQYDDPDATGRFAQVAGLKYTITKSAATGERISNIMVDEGGTFVPIDMDKMYGVVSNSFVRGGGDGYSMFVDAENAYDFGPDQADVMADYLKANAPYTPFVDGRITIIE